VLRGDIITDMMTHVSRTRARSKNLSEGDPVVMLSFNY
jgi:hypothetical protein